MMINLTGIVLPEYYALCVICIILCCCNNHEMQAGVRHFSGVKMLVS